MKTLKKYLLEYLNSNEGWHTKGSLYLVAENEEYSPESCGRELRKLFEEGLIQRDDYKGKRKQTLSKYARLDTQVVPPYKAVQFVEKDGILTAIIN